MYGITKETQSDSQFSNISLGITENIELVKVEFAPAGKDEAAQKVLKFSFKDAAGSTFNHIEWKIKDEEVRSKAIKDGKDPQEQLEKAYAWQAGRIKHIMTKFMSDNDAIIPNVASFDAFCAAVVTKLSPKIAGVKLRIKLVGGGKYPSFPTFPDFIGRMDQPSKLQILPKDKMELSKPDKEKDTSNEEVGASVKTEGEEF